jgi:ABC-type phosphate transport system substrate-binding protein
MTKTWTGALALSVLLAACGGGGDDTSGGTPGDLQKGDAPAGMVTLTGAGATFPYPLYSR